MPTSFEIDNASPRQLATLTSLDAARRLLDQAQLDEQRLEKQLEQARLSRQEAERKFWITVQEARDEKVELMYLAKRAGVGRATLYRRTRDRSVQDDA